MSSRTKCQIAGDTGLVVVIQGNDQYARPPEFTDDALALAFAEVNFASLRYVAALGKWMVWDGTRWHSDDTLIARHRARQICREVSAACNHPKTAKLIASAKTISATERLAQADRRIAATVDQWDSDPWALNTPAGIIDLRSGEIRKHDPLAYLTKITTVAPDDRCPDADMARVPQSHNGWPRGGH
jgi:putative DNA primase/helicase